MDAIDALIEVTVGKEGGYSNNQADSGGKTMWGITEAVARANGYQGPMHLMPRQTAIAIYRKRFLTDPGFDKILPLSPALAAELFDTGVNMGPGTAGIFLQRWLNAFNRQGKDYPDLLVDGGVGEKTRAALQAFLRIRGAEGAAVLLRAMNSLQAARYLELAEAREKDELFIYGWLKERTMA